MYYIYNNKGKKEDDALCLETEEDPLFDNSEIEQLVAVKEVSKRVTKRNTKMPKPQPALPTGRIPRAAIG